MNAFDHHDATSRKNHTSYPHSKLLDTFLPLLGYLCEIFPPCSSLTASNMSSMSQDV